MKLAMSCGGFLVKKRLLEGKNAVSDTDSPYVGSG
jgi:hypothetical protein